MSAHRRPSLWARECDDCLTPTPAVEVHTIGLGEHGVAHERVAYCARCAPTWRPYALAVRPLP